MVGAYGTAEAYKTQQIMTAPPEQLTLMLYNGAIRFINESIAAIQKKQMEKSHNANMRTQSIIRELMATLDMQYEVAKQLMSLYDYIEYRLQSANLRKDIGQLEEVRDLVTDLRDTWGTAIKKVQTERHAGGNMQQDKGGRSYDR